MGIKEKLTYFIWSSLFCL